MKNWQPVMHTWPLRFSDLPTALAQSNSNWTHPWPRSVFGVIFTIIALHWLKLPTGCRCCTVLYLVHFLSSLFFHVPIYIFFFVEFYPETFAQTICTLISNLSGQSNVFIGSGTLKITYEVASTLFFQVVEYFFFCHI